MKPNVIAARQFWQGIVDHAVAKLSDKDAVTLREAFAESGSVCVLELTNHSVQPIKQSSKAKLEVTPRWAVLDNTVLDKIASERLTKRARRKS